MSTECCGTAVPQTEPRPHRYAALIGFAVWLTVIALVASLAVIGVRAVMGVYQREQLRREMYDFLYPVMFQNPAAFDKAGQASQDALLLAALWRITDAEQARLEQNPDADPRYDTDSLGRWCVPLSEVSASYAALFGEDITPVFYTVGEAGTAHAYEYSLPKSCFYVPSDFADSAYLPVLDTITQTDNGYTVRVGYVRRDEAPENEDDLSIESATYIQLYHINEINGRWALRAVTDE